MDRRYTFLLLFVFVFITIQCKREPLRINPKVTNLSDYESNDGKVVLNISGGKMPYNVLWSNHAKDSILTGLSAGVYYVTITDARNNILIDTITVTQPPWHLCVDKDGNSYRTAEMAGRIWMIENLRVTRNTEGEEIDSYVYNDSVEYADKYGRLYTWNSAMQGSVEEKAQGICPDGWHIPSDGEWTFLIDNISTADKEIPNIKKSLNLEYAGFYNNGFYNLNSSVSFWTSTQSHDNAWKRYFNVNLSKAFRYHENKNIAISVRCVKDE